MPAAAFISMRCCEKTSVREATRDGGVHARAHPDDVQCKRLRVDLDGIPYKIGFDPRVCSSRFMGLNANRTPPGAYAGL
jgi:hypothetical protein